MKALAFEQVVPKGDLAYRMVKNYARLEGKEYRPEQIFDIDKNGWPGDWEGRTILALALLARSTGRTPAYLDAILEKLESEFNERGYLKDILPAGMANEQQLSGHNWLLRGLLETYRPAFVHVPGDLPAETGRVLEGFVPALEVEDSVLLRRPGGQGPELHPELALLLTTSGSTGSPKLVRLSGRNLDANTRSIVEYLELDEGQRPVTNLAMSYSYGMSIVNTHLLAGAALVR